MKYRMPPHWRMPLMLLFLLLTGCATNPHPAVKAAAEPRAASDRAG